MSSSETAQPPPPDPSNIQPTTSLPPSTSASNQTNEVPVLNASPPNSSSLSPPSTLSPPPPSYTQATAPTVSDTSAPLIQPLSYPSALDLCESPRFFSVLVLFLSSVVCCVVSICVLCRGMFCESIRFTCPFSLRSTSANPIV